MASWRINHPSTRVSQYAFNGNALDGTGRYPGTLVNAPTWADGPQGRQCIELDGDDAHVNCGDILELNTVTAFTICFWMNQDVLDQQDYIFVKEAVGNNMVRIRTWNTGFMFFEIRVAGAQFGYFDYSTAISAREWTHIAMVFDGPQTGDANRLVAYVGGEPVTLTFSGGIPAVTADLSGQDATIGTAALSFDGKLYDFRIYNIPASRDEINQIIHSPVPTY